MKYAFLLYLAIQFASSSLYAQPPAHEKWQLVWRDEFEGKDSDLDTGWNSFNGGYASTSINCSRWRRNAVEGNGVLKLLYKKEATSGGSGASAWSYNWTAGSIFTKRKFQYGYFECRYKVAGTVGTNNSFWLISSKNKDTSIKTFEIDVNEGWYSPSATNTRQQIRTNVHNWSDTFRTNGTLSHPQQSIKYNPSPWYNIANTYHVMGLEWNEKELIWYLDGKVIRRVANQKKYGATANCFDEAPVYLSAATLTFDLPQPDSLDGKWMEVDYVRVYQKENTVTDVHACIKDSVMLVAYPGIPDATTYRWEVSTFSNGTYNAWSSLSTGPTGVNSTNGFGASYSGVTNDTLIIRNVNNGLQQARYRCRLTTTRSSNTTAYPAAPYIRYADTSIITVNPAIKAAITVPNVNYLGATVHLTASATGGTGNYAHYVWNGPASLADTTKELFISNFKNENNGTYIVNVIDSLGCSDTAMVVINATTSVNPPVVINISDTIKAIALDDINVLPIATGGSGNYTTYLWRGGDNFTSSQNVLKIQGVKTAQSGWYALYVTDDAGYMASKSFYISVAKRSQTISFNPIPNSSYTGNQSQPINLAASASSGLAVQYQSSNTVYGSIVQDKLVANFKRPDYSVQLDKPIVTNRIRIFSSQAAYFHIRELKVFAPLKSGGYADPLVDVLDNDSVGMYNYATKAGVVVSASGTLDAANAAYAAKNAIDGRVTTSWVSQQSGDKFIEVLLPNAVSVGGIQFVNGFFSGGVWNGILSSFLLQYHDGTTWQNISCNTNIYAVQNGDENTESTSAVQNLCINTTAKTITNTTALPVTILSFSLLHPANEQPQLTWTVANEINLAQYVVEASNDGFQWNAIAILAANGKGIYNHAFRVGAQQFGFYRLKLVDANAYFTYSQVVKSNSIIQQDVYKIYPNPVQKYLSVSGIRTFAFYRIKNSIGWQMSNGIVTNQPIDVQNLPQGWYTIELTGTNQRKVIPFFKQ